MLGKWPDWSRPRGGGRAEWREVSPGPINCVYSARKVYGSRAGWRLEQGAVCWVLATGCSSQMCLQISEQESSCGETEAQAKGMSWIPWQSDLSTLLGSSGLPCWPPGASLHESGR